MLKNAYHLALFALLWATASAQTTWGGLRFGMSEQQVKAALGRRALRDKDGALVVKNINLHGFHGDAAFGFSETSKRLEVIVIMLFPRDCVDAQDGHAPDEHQAIERQVAAAFLWKDLSAKYGKPVTSECDHTYDCKAVWQTSSSAILKAHVLGLDDYPIAIMLDYMPKAGLGEL